MSTQTDSPSGSIPKRSPGQIAAETPSAMLPRFSWGACCDTVGAAGHKPFHAICGLVFEAFENAVLRLGEETPEDPVIPMLGPVNHAQVRHPRYAVLELAEAPLGLPGVQLGELSTDPMRTAGEATIFAAIAYVEVTKARARDRGGASREVMTRAIERAVRLVSVLPLEIQALDAGCASRFTEGGEDGPALTTNHNHPTTGAHVAQVTFGLTF